MTFVALTLTLDHLSWYILIQLVCDMVMLNICAKFEVHRFNCSTSRAQTDRCMDTHRSKNITSSANVGSKNLIMQRIFKSKIWFLWMQFIQFIFPYFESYQKYLICIIKGKKENGCIWNISNSWLLPFINVISWNYIIEFAASRNSVEVCMHDHFLLIVLWPMVDSRKSVLPKRDMDKPFIFV